MFVLMRVIKPFYAARLEDLGPGDFVRVECACGHEALLPGSGLIQGMKLPPYTLVSDLERKLRCRECDAEGKLLIAIRWCC